MADRLNYRIVRAKLSSAFITLAWVITVLVWLLGAFAILMQWLNWGMSLDCIQGDPEYGCPTALKASELTVEVLVALALLTSTVWLVAQRLRARI